MFCIQMFFFVFFKRKANFDVVRKEILQYLRRNKCAIIKAVTLKNRNDADKLLRFSFIDDLKNFAKVSLIRWFDFVLNRKKPVS